MFDKLKYFFLYCYEAADRMAEKEAALTEARKKRMEEFRRQMEASREKAKEKYEEVKVEARKYVKEAVSDLGLATKDEVAEVKKLVQDLSAKLDKLAK